MKLKAVLLTVLSIISVQYLFAQTTTTTPKRNTSKVSGKITDATTGNALAGATIKVHDFNAGTTSSADGTYQLNNLPAGKILIEVSYIGYASALLTVDSRTNIAANFALQQSVVEHEEVTVTGVSSATRIKQSPQPVDVIKRQDLVNTPSTNAIDAISKTVPGVNAVTTGPAISKPFIRGLGYNRVVTINDGIRQEGQQWGDEHGIEIDDYSIQRIEVLKGPASIMYGSDALAGVINIQSQVPAPEGTIKANVLSEYQTNNALRGFYANVGGTKNGFSWNAYGTYKGAHDYNNKYDGYVFNSKFYNKDYGAMIGLNKNWGHANLLLSNFDQHIGMVEGERDSATGAFIKVLPGGDEAIATDDDFKEITPEVPFQHIRHFKLTSDNSFNLGNSKLDVVVGYQHNQRQEFGNADNIKTPNAWFDLQTTDFALRLHLPYTGNFKTTVGATGMYQTNTNKGEEVLIPDYDLFDIGGFVYTQYTKDKLTISGGARLDNRHTKADAMTVDGTQKFNQFSRNFFNVSASAGLSYEASKQLALKLNIARGFRAPNFAELASNGAHEGTNRYEIGDNNLTSETSLQTDAGVELTTEHVSLYASLFYNHINNFIFYEKVQNSAGGDSILTDPEEGNELQVFQFDQRAANLYGAELSIDVHPHPLDWLHFKNTFSYTRAKFADAVDNSNNIPFIPPARLITELGVDFLKKGNVIRNLHTGIESDYNFAQNDAFTGYNTETATPDYWLMNASVNAEIVSKSKTVATLSFSAQNISDVAYQNHLSRFKYLAENNVTGRQGVYNMGRNFVVKLNVPLSFNF